jgi:hypothetical protein
LVSEVEKQAQVTSQMQEKKIESQKIEMDMYVQSLHQLIEGFSERINQF